MSTAELAGSARPLQPGVQPNWRGVCARASIVLGVVGLLGVGVFVVVTLTFWLDGLPGAGIVEDVSVLLALGAPVAGLVTGFLGRRSPRRRSAVLGSVLSVLALAGFGVAATATPHDASVGGLAWTPDSTRIAYANYEQDGIWVASADGSGEPTQLVAPGSAPAWSPDGTTICYVAGSIANGGDLWLMDADGHNPRKVRPPDAHDGIGAPYGVGCSWSPDGTGIVFAGAPQGDGSDGIWIMGADGTDLRQVVEGGDAPDWSPDGTRIVYRVQGGSPGGQAEGYWVINVDGTGRTGLPGQGQDVARWTAHGRIVVDCPEGTCITDADGSHRAVLIPDITGAVLASDGTRVAYVKGTGIKSDIVVTTLDQTAEATLIR